MKEIGVVKSVTVWALVLVAASGWLNGGWATAAPLVSAETVEKVAARVTPALVRIHVVDVDCDAGREVKMEASGSGVIYTREGHVITNHHVAGNAEQIVCTMADREDIEADLVASDPLTDICVIKLRPKTPRVFAVARFGDSSRLRVGDPVLAMGSPLAMSQSVTMGIVSNTEMMMPQMFGEFRLELEGEDVGSVVRWIGHDARISGGNSGGPLVNLRGEVVGINEIQFGLAGAIPGNLAREIAEQLITRGGVQRSWIGLEVQPVLQSAGQTRGALVSGTIPDSPAAQAGLMSGDLLLSLAGKEVSVRVVEDVPLLNRLVTELPVGGTVRAVVLRDGVERVLSVTTVPWERRLPRCVELESWGLTARNISGLMATEMGRPNRDGVLVTSLRAGGPADNGKPRLGRDDVILSVAGHPVASLADLQRITETVTAGKTKPTPVLVGYDHNTEHCLTVVEVGKEPPYEPQREVRTAWVPVATQVLTRELATALDLSGRTGVRVTRVYGDAAQGLAVGDIIVAVDGDRVTASRPEHQEVFAATIRQRRVGDEVSLTILRGGEEQKLSLSLQESPMQPREMKRYRDDLFEFTARDVVLMDREKRQWLPGQQGALVEGVDEGGWAAISHLAVGDLILEVDGHATPDVAAVEEQMRRTAAERPEAVVFHIARGIHTLFIELKPQWSTPAESTR